MGWTARAASSQRCALHASRAVSCVCGPGVGFAGRRVQASRAVSCLCGPGVGVAGRRVQASCAVSCECGSGVENAGRCVQTLQPGIGQLEPGLSKAWGDREAPNLRTRRGRGMTQKSRPAILWGQRTSQKFSPQRPCAAARPPQEQ
eukprot:363494-Chlamydomonas_euryale.AAC.1